jgi:Fur family transcriptional regulator, ferric uptake regulator
LDVTRTIAIDALEASKARIRAAGLKWTSSRGAVLRVLERAASPVTHADVVAAVVGDGIEPSTVYRNLVDLHEASLLKRFDLGDHVWRYELRQEGPEHPHFVCDSCGVVECLPVASVSFAKVGRRHVASVLLKGDCVSCG